MNLEIEKDGAEAQKIRFLKPDVSSEQIKYSSSGMSLNKADGSLAHVVYAGENSSGIAAVRSWSSVKKNRQDMELLDAPPEYRKGGSSSFRHVKFVPTYEFTFVNRTEDSCTTKQGDLCRVHQSKHSFIDKVTTKSEFGVRESHKTGLSGDFTELECFIIDADSDKIVSRSTASLSAGSFSSSAVNDGSPAYAACNYSSSPSGSGAASFKGKAGQYYVRVYYKDSVTVSDDTVRTAAEPLYSRKTAIAGTSSILHSKTIHYQTSNQYPDRQGYASNGYKNIACSGLSYLRFTMDDDGNWRLDKETIS